MENIMQESAVLLFLNLGTGEVMLILFIALLLFGGDKLPGMARTVGRGIRDFKDASEDVKREINNQINSFDEKREHKSTPQISYNHEEETYTSEEPISELTVEEENKDITEDVNVSVEAEEQRGEGEQEAEIKRPANTVEYKP